jgi:MFS family permease
VNGSTTATFSLATSFLLAETVFEPFFAPLWQVYRRKPILLVAMVLFLARAIISTLTEDVAVLIEGRIVQGIGGAGTIMLTVVVVIDIVSL